LIGVSACLLGERVRYDGDHRLNRVVEDLLGDRFRPLPVCPELEAGMPVPREKVGLFGSPTNSRMIGLDTGEDWTSRMKQYCEARARREDIASVCGFILKSRSPSCGPGDVKLFASAGEVTRTRRGLFDAAGEFTRTGRGLFASALIDAIPALPVVDEAELEKSAARDEFIQRVMLFHKQRGE